MPDRNNCGVVVPLRRLRKLALEFHDPPRVRYILLHIEYPEFTDLEVVDQLNADDPSETISQVLPLRKIETIQRSYKPTNPHRLSR